MYILDGGRRQIGPFKNRENVERFIKMMALCGEDWADNKVVEEGGEDVTEQNPARMDSCARQWKCTNKLKLVGRRS